jgi:hypothetical protein
MAVPLAMAAAVLTTEERRLAALAVLSAVTARVRNHRLRQPRRR